MTWNGGEMAGHDWKWMKIGWKWRKIAGKDWK